MAFEEPELPGMPEQPDKTPFEAVVTTTRETLFATRERISELVSMRYEINNEIKALRADEERLNRMLRIGEAEAKKQIEGDP